MKPSGSTPRAPLRSAKAGPEPFGRAAVATKLATVMPNGRSLCGTEPKRDELKSMSVEGLLQEVLGCGAAMRTVHDRVRKAAAMRSSVLLVGEAETCKEVVARTIYELSTDPDEPYVMLDCCALSPDTIAEELRGSLENCHALNENGKRRRAGTVFIDGLSRRVMSRKIRDSLVQILSPRRARAGGRTHVKWRPIVSIEAEPEESQSARHIGSDPFDGLCEVVIPVPALREHPEDIPFLVQRFSLLSCDELKRKPVRFSAAAMETLVRHRWLGNIDELRSTVRRGVLLAEDMVEPAHLLLNSCGAGIEVLQDSQRDTVAFKVAVRRRRRQIETAFIIKALRTTGGNKRRAAELLQVHYKTLLTKIKQYGIATTSTTDRARHVKARPYE